MSFRFALVATLLLSGCATTDARTSYLRTLEAYNVAASSMALYCENPISGVEECKKAAEVAASVAVVDAAVTGSAPCTETSEGRVCAGDWATAEGLLTAAATFLRSHAMGVQ